MNIKIIISVADPHIIVGTVAALWLPDLGGTAVLLWRSRLHPPNRDNRFLGSDPKDKINADQKRRNNVSIITYLIIYNWSEDYDIKELTIS